MLEPDFGPNIGRYKSRTEFVPIESIWVISKWRIPTAIGKKKLKINLSPAVAKLIN